MQKVVFILGMLFYSCTDNEYMLAQFGVRYWFLPAMVLNTRLGTGSSSGSSLDVGVDFKF